MIDVTLDTSKSLKNTHKYTCDWELEGKKINVQIYSLVLGWDDTKDKPKNWSHKNIEKKI